MIDFEIMQAAGRKVTEEVPELQAIFGREAIEEGGQRHAGGWGKGTEPDTNGGDEDVENDIIRTIQSQTPLKESFNTHGVPPLPKTITTREIKYNAR